MTPVSIRAQSYVYLQAALDQTAARRASLGAADTPVRLREAPVTSQSSDLTRRAVHGEEIT